MRRNRSRSNRGIATITAVFMIAMVGAAVAALSILFAFEARRTRMDRSETQLRELLFAGAIAGRDAVGQSTGEGTAVPVPLPAALQAQEATLSVAVTPGADGTHRLLRVTATLGRQTAEQVVTFERTGNAWQAVDARIVRPF